MDFKKLAISQSWLHSTFPYNPRLFPILKTIQGSLHKFNIFHSTIYVSEFPKLYIFHFTLFLVNSQHYLLLKKILSILKPLLTLRYNKNIVFHLKLTPSIYYDDKFLSKSFKYLLQQNPIKLRILIQQLMEKKLIVQPSKFQKSQLRQPSLHHPSLKENLFKIHSLTLPLSKLHFKP